MHTTGQAASAATACSRGVAAGGSAGRFTENTLDGCVLAKCTALLSQRAATSMHVLPCIWHTHASTAATADPPVHLVPRSIDRGQSAAVFFDTLPDPMPFGSQMDVLEKGSAYAIAIAMREVDPEKLDTAAAVPLVIALMRYVDRNSQVDWRHQAVVLSEVGTAVVSEFQCFNACRWAQHAARTVSLLMLAACTHSSQHAECLGPFRRRKAVLSCAHASHMFWQSRSGHKLCSSSYISGFHSTLTSQLCVPLPGVSGASLFIKITKSVLVSVCLVSEKNNAGALYWQHNCSGQHASILHVCLASSVDGLSRPLAAALWTPQSACTEFDALGSTQRAGPP
jgi:hypothetical protein